MLLLGLVNNLIERQVATKLLLQYLNVYCVEMTLIAYANLLSQMLKQLCSMSILQFFELTKLCSNQRLINSEDMHLCKLRPLILLSCAASDGAESGARSGLQLKAKKLCWHNIACCKLSNLRQKTRKLCETSAKAIGFNNTAQNG